MIGIRSILLAAALLGADAIVLRAQSPTEQPGDSLAMRQRFGLVGALGLNAHIADFTEIPGIPNCSPGFRSGFGLAPSIALLYERPLASRWMIQLRAGYLAEDATLTRAEQSFVDINGTAALIDIDHSISASLGTVALEPLAAYRLGPRLALLGGGRIGYRLDASYSQKEQLADNIRQGTFENGRRVRNESSGLLPDVSRLDVAIEAGASYEIPLNGSRTMLAAPELMLSYGVTPVVSSLSWSAHALRAGIALKYAPSADTAPRPPVVIPSPPPRVLAARIVAVGVDADGTEERAVRLRVEEFISTDVHPLLGYVFFARGSSELDRRYDRVDAEHVADFDTATVYRGATLAIYHHLLNIIGRRMLDHPSARLRLHGTSDGTPAESRALALERAEAVASYLRDAWGVSSDRLDVDAGDLPALRSNPAYAEGMEENRRVELSSSDASILAPVHGMDTLREATPPVLRFRPEVVSTAGVREWRAWVRQEGRMLKQFSGSGAVPSVLEWAIGRPGDGGDGEEMPRVPGELYYGVEVIDSSGARAESALGRIGVEQVTVQSKRSQRVADMEMERYSLTVFDYGRAELSREHEAVLRGIRERIGERSRVIVTGYTDRLGEAAYNARLAEERARAVARALGVDEERVEVRWESEPPYENLTPEGRFYSRTVTVEIRTPVVEGKSG